MIRRAGRPGLMGTMARTAVVAGTATAVSGAVSNKQQQKYAAKQDAAAAQQQAAYEAGQQAATQQAAAAPAPAPAAGGLTDEAMDQLKKLGELKASGVLSDEEFTAAKAKILGI